MIIIQQLTNVMYCKFLGISKLSEKSDLPVIRGDFDGNAIPFVQGSNEIRQVRYFWNKPHKGPHNHKAIMTLASFAKSHGREYISEAGEYLDVIKQGDLESRFITKYQALQKIFRGTTGKKSTKPGGELTRNKRDNRTCGMSGIQTR